MTEYERTQKSQHVTGGPCARGESRPGPGPRANARGETNWRGFFFEALESLAIAAAFVIAGLAWAIVEQATVSAAEQATESAAEQATASAADSQLADREEPPPSEIRFPDHDGE